MRYFFVFLSTTLIAQEAFFHVPKPGLVFKTRLTLENRNSDSSAPYQIRAFDQGGKVLSISQTFVPSGQFRSQILTLALGDIFPDIDEISHLAIKSLSEDVYGGFSCNALGNGNTGNRILRTTLPKT